MLKYNNFTIDFKSQTFWRLKYERQANGEQEKQMEIIRFDSPEGEQLLHGLKAQLDQVIVTKPYGWWAEILSYFKFF